MIHRRPTSFYEAAFLSCCDMILFKSRRQTAMIRLKRAYEPASRSDGARYLVERLWPRGVKKESLNVEGWLKDVAPSTELRKWFSHNPPSGPNSAAAILKNL